jgi:membrane-anchored glycerophosphoryl diester phosphodiesterase (GDPDase)
VLHDFILPHMALDGATFREAWRAVRQRIRSDREGFFSYFLLRVLIVIITGPVLAVLAFMVLWPVLWVLGASAAGYNALLDDATGLPRCFESC